MGAIVRVLGFWWGVVVVCLWYRWGCERKKLWKRGIKMGRYEI